MVATKYAYSKGKKLARSFSAVFSIFFGLFALFFTATPKLWDSESSNQNIFTNFFTQNVAHADVPHYGDAGGGGGDAAAGDSTGGVGGPGGVDSVGDSVGGGVGDNSGGCGDASGAGGGAVA